MGTFWRLALAAVAVAALRIKGGIMHLANLPVVDYDEIVCRCLLGDAHCQPVAEG